MRIFIFITFFLCFVTLSSQRKQIGTNLGKVVFLCDSTCNKLDLTVVDNIPYLHKPDQGPMTMINPEDIKYVQVISFVGMYKSEYEKIEKYRSKIRSQGFPAIFTKTGKGITF